MPVGVVQARGNIRFSPSGTYAACVARPVTGEAVLERWDFGSAVPARTAARAGPPVPPRCQLAPLDDGRLLILRQGSDRHEVALVGVDGFEVTLGTVAGDVVRLIAAPGGGADGRPAGHLLVPCGEGTRLLAVGDRPGGIDHDGPLIPGSVGATAWLDTAGRALGFTHLHDRRTHVAVLDPATGELRTLWFPGNEPTHLLLAAPGADGLPLAGGGLLLARGGPGGLRFGWAARDGLREPAALATLDGTVLPLAVAPDGSGVAFSVTRGTTSRLVIWRPDTDAVEPVDLGAPGRITGAGGWDARGLRVPFSTSDHPNGFACVDRGSVTLHPQPERRWLAGVSEWFDGPAGAIEAVTYRDWRTADHVVIALHDGPDSAWTLAFEPLFQYLAAAGVAVVAPNQRGSAGYGDAHRAAIRNAWGGPDLADVVHLTADLARRRSAAATVVHRFGAAGIFRRPPTVLGIGYGAFLAVLAAERAPHLIDRCVAVAPFTSGARLRADAGVAARRMIDRLGGADRTADLERLAPRLTVPLLLIHGTDDRTVPIAHSRRIARAARQPLVEVPGAGHDPFVGPRAPMALARVADFLRAEFVSASLLSTDACQCHGHTVRDAEEGMAASISGRSYHGERR